MTVEEALMIADALLNPRYLNRVQELVFRESWEGKTYPEIAAKSGYGSEYIKLIGFQVWQSLSQAFGEKVTKNNFRSLMRRRFSASPLLQELRRTDSTNPNTPNSRSIFVGESVAGFASVRESSGNQEISTSIESCQGITQNSEVKRIHTASLFRVFIAYCPEYSDFDLAQDLEKVLADAGYEVFLVEQESIRKPEIWPVPLAPELQRSDYLLLLMARQSQAVQ